MKTTTLVQTATGGTVTTDYGSGVVSTTNYRSRNGVVEWLLTDGTTRVAPEHALVEYGIPFDPAKQAAAARAEGDRFARQYRKAMRNHKPSAEEMFEMEAAFGKGTTVVNVLTGRAVRL